MDTLIDVISWIDAVVLASLSAIGVRRWRAEGAPGTFWLALTFATLALVLVIGQLLPESSPVMVTKLLVIVLLLFPYFLFRFGAAIDPPPRWIENVAGGLTALIAVFALVLPDFPEDGESQPAYITAFVVLFLVQWTVLSLTVALRLWRAGADQPALARRRMRLLCMASIALNAAIIIVGLGASSDSDALSLFTQVLVIGSSLLFFAGFAPPPVLRNIWRLREQEQLRQATVKLMVATSSEEITSSILPHVAAMVGARGVAIVNPEGEVTAQVGVSPAMSAEIDELRTAAEGKKEVRRADVFGLRFPFGLLVVWGTRYTPLFGPDEIVLARSLGALTSLALERAELFERERRGRRALETANADLESATVELEQEIAERRRTEGELIESQMQLAEAQELTGLGSWSWDTENNRLTWSDQLYRIYGVDSHQFEATYEAYLELVHPDDREKAQKTVQSLYETSDSFAYDHRILRPDGKVRIVQARGKAIRDISGKPIRVIGTSQDITKRKRDEEALRASEMRFRNVAQSAAEAIISADENGVISFWNRGAADLFGYWEDEVLGQRLEILMPPRYRNRHRAGLERFLKTGEARVVGSMIELEGLRKDGSEFPIELSLATWTAEGERFFTGIVRDISARKESERELERASHNNELILRAAGDGIYGLDADGSALFVNPAAARMLGFSVDELIGVNMHEATHHTRPDGTHYPAEECPVRATLMGAGAARVDDDVFWRKNGTSFPVEYTATPMVEGGRIRGAVVVFRDISERHEFERMKAVERLKEELVGVVSHELRTPLTSIRGALGLLSSGLLGSLPPKGERMLQIASVNTERLVRLINDMLDIERIESEELPLEVDDHAAADIVGDTVEALQGIAADQGVDVVVERSEGRLRGDADLLLQALTNLVGNAIKFTSTRGRVWISTTSQGDFVLFSVRDEGRGIPEDKLDAVFERFAQVDSSDARRRGGTGLGLAITRSIILRHGGRIWAESTVGAGSTFYFTVPAADEAATVEPAQRSTSDAGVKT